MVYTDDNIDALLHQRHAAQKFRRGGGRLKGPSKRGMEENRAFETALGKILHSED